MVTKEEFEQFVSEIESLRDMLLEEIVKMRSEIEKIRYDLDDVKKELVNSGKIVITKRIN